MRTSFLTAAAVVASSLAFHCGAEGGSSGTEGAPPPPAAGAPTAAPSPTTPPTSPPAQEEPGPAPGFHVVAQYTDVGHGLAYANGFVYSVNYTEDSVWVFDAKTFKTVKKLPVGLGPGRLAVAEPYVFVVNMMASDPGDAYVSVIDTRSNTVTKSLTVSQKQQGGDPDNYPMTSFPWAAHPVGKSLFVTFPTNAEPDVLPVEIGTWTEQPLWAAGSGPGSLAGVGDRIAVVNGRGITSADDDAVLLYSTTGQLLKTLETSGRLHESIVVGDKIVVARAPSDHAKGELVVIDPSSLSYDAIPTCSGPVGVASNGGSTVFTACQWARRVDEVDIAARTVKSSIDLTTVTPAVTNPRGIAVTPAGDVWIESDGLISAFVR